MRRHKEYGNDHRRKELEQIGIKAKSDNLLINYIIDNSAQSNSEKLKPEGAENLAENYLADDDGGKSDNDRTASHLNIGKSLILNKERTRKSDDAVRDHKSENGVKAGVDALRSAHIDVLACCTKRTAKLRSEEPIQQGNDYNDENRNNQYIF